MAEGSSPTQAVMTPEAMLSYPNLFEPRVAEEGKKPTFDCALVFAPGADLAKLRAAAGAAAKDRWGDKAGGMFKAGQLKFPFREDAEDKGYPAGSVFINVRTTRKPGIVSIYAGPDGKPQQITDPDQVYPGCFVRATVRAFAYENSGNKGVSFALNNVQKLRDGERLDTYRKAEDEFEAEAGAVASDEFSTAPAPAAPAAVPTMGEQQVAALAGKAPATVENDPFV